MERIALVTLSEDLLELVRSMAVQRRRQLERALGETAVDADALHETNALITCLDAVDFDGPQRQVRIVTDAQPADPITEADDPHDQLMCTD